MPEDEPDGQWMTEELNLSHDQVRAWKYNIESGLKLILFEFGVTRVNVIATYHPRSRRFHVCVSRSGYQRDTYLSCYAS